MSISRKVALNRLSGWINLLEEWRDQIDCPTALTPGGDEVPINDDDLPEEISVSKIPGISGEPIAQLKGELSLVSAEIDALAALL